MNLTVAITSYTESFAAIRYVRDVVFGDEQRIPREIDWDGNDEHCTHVLATDEAGNPVGTGRMQPDGRIGRLAVLKQWRGQGIGAQMLEALVVAARERGLESVYLHAQTHAALFYEKSGFQKDGHEFVEAGIHHVNMVRSTQ